MTALVTMVDRLSTVSRERQVPLGAAIAWPDFIDENAWCFSEELISLYGTPAYDGMNEVDKKRLSLLEAVNFFSLNVHGEKGLIEGIARRLHSGSYETISPYLHHFLDEENKHMFCFAEFCRRYAGKVYCERKFAIPRPYAPGEEDFLFFAKAFIFEEVVNVYNLRMARDARLAPVVRAINRCHHLDEARHLAFGRNLVSALFERHALRWPDDTRAAIRRYLADYLNSMRGDYFNPDVYRDLGLANALSLRDVALRDGERQALWYGITEGCRSFLIKNGILIAESKP